RLRLRGGSSGGSATLPKTARGEAEHSGKACQHRTSRGPATTLPTVKLRANYPVLSGVLEKPGRFAIVVGFGRRAGRQNGLRTVFVGRRSGCGGFPRASRAA